MGGTRAPGPMSQRPRQQTPRILALLHDAELPFVVVGGVAANAHGAVRQTQDLDVVMPMTPEVLDRLLDVLRPFHPRHALRRDLGPISQDGEVLSTFRMLLIETDLGRLDVISEIPPIGRYDDLATITLRLSGRDVRFVTLEQLIEIKAAAGRPKDILAVEELRAIAATLADGTAGDDPA